MTLKPEADPHHIPVKAYAMDRQAPRLAELETTTFEATIKKMGLMLLLIQEAI